MVFSFADASAHLGVFVAVIALGFAIGIYGHVIRSRTLILTGIIVIGAISLYFVATGEVQTFPR